MTRTNPLQSLADLRAERHARSFVKKQRPAVDPRVLEHTAKGYLPIQIASMLKIPVSDVKLMLAMAKERT